MLQNTFYESQQKKQATELSKGENFCNFYLTAFVVGSHQSNLIWIGEFDCRTSGFGVFGLWVRNKNNILVVSQSTYHISHLLLRGEGGWLSGC